MSYAMRTVASIVIPDRREAAKPESITPVPVVMDSGFLAELVIGPTTSGRTRWLGPGMTDDHSNSSFLIFTQRSTLALMSAGDRKVAWKPPPSGFSSGVRAGTAGMAGR